MNQTRALERAIKLAGGQAELERKLKGAVKQQTISLWLKTGMPSRWAIPVARAIDFKVTPNQLAPAAYPNEWDGLPIEKARPLIMGLAA